MFEKTTEITVCAGCGKAFAENDKVIEIAKTQWICTAASPTQPLIRFDQSVRSFYYCAECGDKIELKREVKNQ